MRWPQQGLGVAWESLIDDSEDGKYWTAKFDYEVGELPIEEATTSAGITDDENMHFLHPDRI